MEKRGDAELVAHFRIIEATGDISIDRLIERNQHTRTVSLLHYRITSQRERSDSGLINPGDAAEQQWYNS
jgi:hypothetical protein